MDDVLVLKEAPRFSPEEIRRAAVAGCRRAGACLAVLFGSYARGTADAWSDVDLLFVLETDEPFLERWRLLEDVVRALPGCELLVYTPEELEGMRGRGVVARALAEGVTLFERSDAGGSAR